jgi:hypothetical protein
VGSNPAIGTLENAILRGKCVRIGDLIGCERSRTKTHEMSVYVPNIRQVTGSRLALIASADCKRLRISPPVRLILGRMANVIKGFSRDRDYMLLANFESVSGSEWNGRNSG